MSELKTLETLQVGDEVIVTSGGWSNRRVVRKVEKVHKLHLVVEGVKYGKKGGFVAGNGYSRGRIQVSGPEGLDKVRLEELDHDLKRRIERVKWEEIPLEGKQRIIAILEESALAQARGEESGL